MPLSADEQKLYDFVRGALPAWFTSQERVAEDLGAMVKAGDMVRARIEYMHRQGQILLADGPIGDDPDWLNQHAADRATARQDGETDDALRERLRTFEDAVTLPALRVVAQALLDADGVTGDLEFVELLRDQAFTVVRQRIQGTAGGADAFTKAGDVMTLALAGVTFQGGMLYWDRGEIAPIITIAGATSPANDGDFAVTGFDGESIQWENAAGVAEVYAGTWTIGAALHDHPDAYCDRGYRAGSMQPTLVTVLPYGTTEALRLAVHEAVRQRRAAGVVEYTEARSIP